MFEFAIELKFFITKLSADKPLKLFLRLISK